MCKGKRKLKLYLAAVFAEPMSMFRLYNLTNKFIYDLGAWEAAYTAPESAGIGNSEKEKDTAAPSFALWYLDQIIQYQKSHWKELN